LFEIAGKKTDDYVKIVPIDPFYNVRFEDGTIFRYNGDKDSILKQIEALNPEDVKGYHLFIKDAEKIFKA
jgi:phytoene desaturase